MHRTYSHSSLATSSTRSSSVDSLNRSSSVEAGPQVSPMESTYFIAPTRLSETHKSSILLSAKTKFFSDENKLIHPYVESTIRTFIRSSSLFSVGEAGTIDVHIENKRRLLQHYAETRNELENTLFNIVDLDSKHKTLEYYDFCVKNFPRV